MAFLWQTTLHSWVGGSILLLWSRHLGLPSGRTRRRLLAMLLVVPLVTAAVPGRGSWEFRDGGAWFDSYRILALPLPFGFHVQDVVAALFVLTAAITLYQELLPIVRGWRHGGGSVADPEAAGLVGELVKDLPAFAGCSARIIPTDAIVVETDGTPRRPVLRVSSGALTALPREELEAVLRHEAAHVSVPTWLAAHALFVARIVQIVNPMALWAFREYTNEVEILCDREAARTGGPRVLARALLKVYQWTDRSDIAGRAALQHRVDTLLGRRVVADDALPPATEAVAVLVLLVVLPWIV